MLIPCFFMSNDYESEPQSLLRPHSHQVIPIKDQSESHQILPQVCSLYLSNLNIPEPHQIIPNNIIKNLKANPMLWERIDQHYSPVFMSGGLWASKSMYHDFTMISLLRHKTLWRKWRRINSMVGHILLRHLLNALLRS